MIRTFISCLVLLFCSVSPSYSNSFEEGRDENSVQAIQSLQAYAKYKMADYHEAREIWLRLAAKNNTTAMINLANLYDQGQGVERDLAKSVVWLKKAAVLNDTRGQYQLAMAYEKGLGVQRDLKQAAYWLGKAARLGDETAQFALGVMLATNYGEGLSTSSQQQRIDAKKWLQKAEKSGVIDAKEFLKLLSSMM